MSAADRTPDPAAMSDAELDALRDLVRARWAERLAAAGADEATSPRQAELYRVAAAARALIARLVATEAPEETLRATADDLEAAAAHLVGFRQGMAYEFREVANAAGSTWAQFDHSPLLGRANPLAPPVTLKLEADVVRGEVTFSDAYEGPPGCVHGGYIAAVFDELLGAAQGLGGQPGMTGTLTIRYRRPTPLRTRLVLEGRLDRMEGRKTFVTGTCTVDGAVTAEAEGTFISIDPRRFVELRAEREARVAADRAGSEGGAGADGDGGAGAEGNSPIVDS